jgi:hypothetical protein
MSVAAVLVLRRSLGLETAKSGVQQALIEVSGAPRTPKEILASAQAVLEGAVTVGLSHLSPAVVERLLTLAVSALAANLPRVSLALRSVSDEVRAILQREARADESRLLLSAASLYALIEASSRCDDATAATLAGVARRQYVEVPEIELLGVGAYPWKSRFGISRTHRALLVKPKPGVPVVVGRAPGEPAVRSAPALRGRWPLGRRPKPPPGGVIADQGA